MNENPSLELSRDQTAVVERIEQWLDESPNPTLTFGGLAGTGKTTIVAALPELLDIDNIVYCAPTGKAARVLTSKLKGGRVAQTIHQLVYEAEEEHCRICPTYLDASKECHATQKSGCGCVVHFWYSTAKRRARKLYVVDESSMVTKQLYFDLMNFVGQDKVLFVGDHGQLPPVKSDFDLMRDPEIKLEVIHRQAADSPILRLAMQARQTGRIPFGEFGHGVCKINKSEFVMKFDIDNTLIISAMNRTRVAWNTRIRAAIGIEGPPIKGDRVICLKNNWSKGVYNGLSGVIETIQPNGDKYSAWIELEDGNSYVGTISARQFNADSTLLNDQCDLFDFGYCLTAHKAQGSQAENVIVIEESMPWVPPDERKRWLYTAVTRATKTLTVLG